MEKTLFTKIPLRESLLCVQKKRSKPLVRKVWSADQRRQHYLETAWDLVRDADSQASALQAESGELGAPSRECGCSAGLRSHWQWTWGELRTCSNGKNKGSTASYGGGVLLTCVSLVRRVPGWTGRSELGNNWIALCDRKERLLRFPEEP